MIAILALLTACVPHPAPPAASATEPPAYAPASIGSADARFTVQVWSDYACPWCARAYEPLAAYIAAHSDTRLVTRHYPLSTACNPHVGRDLHPNACAIALAGICASAQGRTAEASTYLYAQQGHPVEPAALQEAAHLDGERWRACMEAPEAAAALARDIDEGFRAGVQGTPTIYVSGVDPRGWVQGGAIDVITLIDMTR
jgi:protein-disulfide isomerase